MKSPRTTTQRQADTRSIFESRPPDVWVASASQKGAAHLVPLSFAWDGTNVTLAVRADSATGRNIIASRSARLGFGTTRDVVMVDGVLVDHISAAEADDAIVDRYAAKTHWDPREEDAEYVYLVLAPRRIQAWRESDELADRTVMRDGAWVS